MDFRRLPKLTRNRVNHEDEMGFPGGLDSTCWWKGRRFDSLVWEEPPALEKRSACTTTIEPVPQSPRAAVTEPISHRCKGPGTWSPCPTTADGTTGRSPRTATKSRPCSPWAKKAHVQRWRPGIVNKNHSENKWANTSLKNKRRWDED